MDNPPQPTILRGPMHLNVTPTHSTMYHPQDSQDMYMDLDPKVVLEFHCYELLHWKTCNAPAAQPHEFDIPSGRSARCTTDLPVLAHSDQDPLRRAESIIRMMFYCLMNPTVPIHPRLLDAFPRRILSFARDKARSVSTAGLVQLTLVVHIRAYATVVYHQGSALSPQPTQACQETLKTEIYKEDVASEEEEGSSEAAKECPICLDAFVAGAAIVQLPCRHGFHEGCIFNWMSQSPSCPLCRADLRHLTSDWSQLVGAGVARSVIQSLWSGPNLSY